MWVQAVSLSTQTTDLERWMEPNLQHFRSGQDISQTVRSRVGNLPSARADVCASAQTAMELFFFSQQHCKLEPLKHSLVRVTISRMRGNKSHRMNIRAIFLHHRLIFVLNAIVLMRMQCVFIDCYAFKLCFCYKMWRWFRRKLDGRHAPPSDRP